MTSPDTTHPPRPDPLRPEQRTTPFGLVALVVGALVTLTVLFSLTRERTLWVQAETEITTTGRAPEPEQARSPAG